MAKRFAPDTLVVRYDEKPLRVTPLPLKDDEIQITETPNSPKLRKPIQGRLASPKGPNE